MKKSTIRSVQAHRQRMKKASKDSLISKTPAPVLEEILFLSIDSFNSLMKIALTCKKFYEIVIRSQPIWQSLSLKTFSKGVSLLNPQTSYFDWRSFYMEQRLKKLALIQKKNAKEFSNLLTNEKNSKQKIEKLDLRATWRGQSISKKHIFHFGSGMSIIVCPETPTKDIGQLEINLLSTSLTLKPKGALEKLHNADVSLLKNENVLIVQYKSKEICFMNWTINYVDLLVPVTSYKIKPRYDDISSQFGFYSYSFLFELRTGGNSIYQCRLPTLDLLPEGAYGVGYVEDIHFPISKSKVFLGWKTDAFSGKFNNVSIVDCTLRSEFKEPIWWISESGILKCKTRDLEGDVYLLTIESRPGKIEVLFKDTGEEWLLLMIKVYLEVTFIQSVFVRSY